MRIEDIGYSFGLAVASVLVALGATVMPSKAPTVHQPKPKVTVTSTIPAKPKDQPGYVWHYCECCFGNYCWKKFKVN